jgi:hypothetical protein
VGAEIVRTGEIFGTIRSALVGQSFGYAVLNITLSVRQLAISAGFIILNFPNLLLPAAVYGIVRGAHLGVPVVARRAFLAGLIIHACFVLRYPVIDQHTFFLPVYVLLAIFGGIGFAVLMQKERTTLRRLTVVSATALLALTPVLYGFAPGVARGFDILADVARNKPYRDDYVYIFTPWSVVERSAEIMSRQAVELGGKHGLIIVEDTMGSYAVRYHALRSGMEGQTITREVAPERIIEAVGAGRTVVLVPHNIEAPRAEPPIGIWRRDGDLYVLDPVPADP